MQAPDAGVQDQTDAQRVDLIVSSESDGRCVAEWSKAEHKAVEAMVSAHMSGEKNYLDTLELREEVVHDCMEISPKEPVSTEWADFSNIAPLGAASRAFLESIFSKSMAAVLQRQQQRSQQVEPSSDASDTSQEPGEQEATDNTAMEPQVPHTLARRHFADYQSKSDLPVRISGVSEEELRPFKSIGLPVQMEGMPKLIRLKGAPPLLLNKQIAKQERLKDQTGAKPADTEEEEQNIYQLEDSEVALLQDLKAVEGDDMDLEDLKKALLSGEEEMPPQPLPPPEPEPEPSAELKAEPQMEIVREPGPEEGATNEAQDADAPEGSEGQAMAVTHEEQDASVEESVEEINDEETYSQDEETAMPQSVPMHRPTTFKSRVFHSLCEESQRQTRAKLFRRSIIIKGVGSVAVRRRSDFTNLPVARNSNGDNFGA